MVQKDESLNCSVSASVVGGSNVESKEKRRVVTIITLLLDWDFL